MSEEVTGMREGQGHIISFFKQKLNWFISNPCSCPTEGFKKKKKMILV